MTASPTGRALGKGTVDWASVAAFIVIVVMAYAAYTYRGEIQSGFPSAVGPILFAYGLAVTGVFGVTVIRGGEHTRSVLEKLFGVFGPVPFALECAGLWIMFYAGSQLVAIGIGGGFSFQAVTDTLIEVGSGLIWMAASVVLLWDRGRSSFVKGQAQVVPATTQ